MAGAIEMRVTKKVVTKEKVTVLQVRGNSYTAETRVKTKEEFMDGYGRAVAVCAGSAPKKLEKTAHHRKTLKEAPKPKTADNKVKEATKTADKVKAKVKEPTKTADKVKVKVPTKAASGPTSDSGRVKGKGVGGGGQVKVVIGVKVAK